LWDQTNHLRRSKTRMIVKDGFYRHDVPTILQDCGEVYRSIPITFGREVADAMNIH
jgi:hypothetical protein